MGHFGSFTSTFKALFDWKLRNDRISLAHAILRVSCVQYSDEKKDAETDEIGGA